VVNLRQNGGYLRQICGRKRGKIVIKRWRLVVNLLQKGATCAIERGIFAMDLQ